ncbi:phosphotransferase family protein [Nocardioides caricicola]|uniref:Phosphotransferase family protein n=1 Tax=Nocardioides caricicola TaxID=634770 RepID=A0ABW0N5L0_9ACTN
MDPPEADDPFASLQPLEGGWSGETFVAEAGGDRTVVRIFAGLRHSPQAAEIQAALLRLVRGLLPVPEVLEVRPGLLVTSFLPGVRGDLLLPTLDDAGLRRVGESFGRVAGVLGGMPLLTRGVFADGELRIERYDVELPDSLGALAARAHTVLDQERRTCLVHSDLNPKNLLVDPDSLEVTGVLDWEFAHAGHPFTDLGNLLRFDRAPAYVGGVLAAYGALRGTRPEHALDLARAADLHALVELASRAGENPVADRAAARVEAIVAAQDWHATE